MRNCESVLMHNFFTPQSPANWIANVDACISPQLFVALPLTGFATFLKVREEFRFKIQKEIHERRASSNVQRMLFSKVNPQTGYGFRCTVTFARTIGKYMNKSVVILRKGVRPIRFQSCCSYLTAVHFSSLIRFDRIGRLRSDSFRWFVGRIGGIWLRCVTVGTGRSIDFMVELPAVFNYKVNGFVVGGKFPKNRRSEAFDLSLTLWPIELNWFLLNGSVNSVDIYLPCCKHAC